MSYKVFLSVNNEFFKYKPDGLIYLINKYNESKYICGFEIATSSEEDEKYVKEFARLLGKDSEYIINLHAPTFNMDYEIDNYTNFVNEVAMWQGRKINVVYHPTNDEETTRNNLNRLNTNADNYYISIENLNVLNGIERPKKEDLVPFLNSFNGLKFTFDIGHELVDNIHTTTLDPIFTERLNNIHIHSNRDGVDHYPITDINEVKNLLMNYGEDKPIVMEYALEYINGSTFEEKIKYYISCGGLINATY